MQGHFAFGDIGAWPGDKTTGFFHVPGTSIAMPLTVINGVAPGPTLLVTAGIHGGEYPSIEAAMRFTAALVPTAVSGQVSVWVLGSADASDELTGTAHLTTVSCIISSREEHTVNA